MFRPLVRKRTLILVTLLFCFPESAWSLADIKITGTIINNQTGNPIEAVTVLVKESGTPELTDQYGEFMLKFDPSLARTITNLPQGTGPPLINKVITLIVAIGGFKPYRTNIILEK